MSLCRNVCANRNTYSSNVTCFTCMPVTTWRFGRVSLSGYIMLCGTSERFPVFASIHLNVKSAVKSARNQAWAHEGAMYELGPSLGERELCQASCKRTHEMADESRRDWEQPTVYTLTVWRSFVSVSALSGGVRARAGSSALATCRN